MDKMEFYSFFCEDVRFEKNGAPMILGLMSPVFFASEYPVEFSKINLLTFFKTPLHIPSFSSRLVLTKLSGLEEDEIGNYSADFERDEVEESPFHWASYTELPIERISLSEGDTLRASVSVEEHIHNTYLTAGEIREKE